MKDLFEEAQALKESSPRLTALYKQIDGLRRGAGRAGAGSEVLSAFDDLLEKINDDIVYYDMAVGDAYKGV